MRTLHRLIAPVFALFCLLLAAGPVTAAGLQTDTLTVETASGAKHRFTVELALTLDQQARGLMFRETLEDDRGMLFLYDVPQPLSFWMKNTLIPLDIVYIAGDGHILNIRHGKPHDLTQLTSAGDALAVLELNGGLAARLGIRPGDMVRHPAFGLKRDKP